MELKFLFSFIVSTCSFHRDFDSFRSVTKYFVWLNLNKGYVLLKSFSVLTSASKSSYTSRGWKHNLRRHLPGSSKVLLCNGNLIFFPRYNHCSAQQGRRRALPSSLEEEPPNCCQMSVWGVSSPVCLETVFTMGELGKARPSSTPHSTKPGGTHVRSLAPFNEEQMQQCCLSLSGSHTHKEPCMQTDAHSENSDNTANAMEGRGSDGNVYVRAPTHTIVGRFVQTDFHTLK